MFFRVILAVIPAVIMMKFLDFSPVVYRLTPAVNYAEAADRFMYGYPAASDIPDERGNRELFTMTADAKDIRPLDIWIDPDTGEDIQSEKAKSEIRLYSVVTENGNNLLAAVNTKCMIITSIGKVRFPIGGFGGYLCADGKFSDDVYYQFYKGWTASEKVERTISDMKITAAIVLMVVLFIIMGKVYDRICCLPHSRK